MFEFSARNYEVDIYRMSQPLNGSSAITSAPAYERIISIIQIPFVVQDIDFSNCERFLAICTKPALFVVLLPTLTSLDNQVSKLDNEVNKKIDRMSSDAPVISRVAFTKLQHIARIEEKFNKVAFFFKETLVVVYNNDMGVIVVADYMHGSIVCRMEVNS